MLTGIIRGQRLILRTPLVVADSINYLTAKFAFDADWKGRVITAYFVCGDKTITAELTSGEITAAQGINLTAGRWELKLSGIKADSRVTAGPVWFDVLPFGAADGELPDISLTQYEQLLAKIGDMDELTTADKNTLVAAINEAAQSGGGSGGGGLPAGGTPGQVLTRTASGSAWQDGTPGPVGPNEITADTATNINGLLKGAGGKVAPAEGGTDYLTPPVMASSLPASGTALTANTIYNVSSPVGTYVFTPPASGWAHGIFSTAASVAVSFVSGANYLGEAPAIEASKTYEFDVYNGVWAVQEVVSA